MNRCKLWLLATCTLLFSASVQAQQANVSELDPTPIRAAVSAYEKAYNDGDIKSLIAMWTDDAVYTNRLTQEEFQGKKALQEYLQSVLSATPRAKMVLTSDSIRFLSPSIAVEHGTAQLIAAEDAVEFYHYTAIYLKQNGKWLLERVTDEESESVAYHSKLKELEWMIGDWEAKSEDASVSLSCNWTTNKSYLKRSFTLVMGGESLVGTQLIGWDPVAKTIRSWTFDQQGAFAEGTWTLNKEQWTIANKGYQADGTKVGMVNVMKVLDENSFSWKTIDRMAGGELLPSLPEVVLTRVTEEAE